VGDNDWPEDIHFANGLWVCANDYGQIYTSADLAIWTLRYDAPLPWILTSIDYQNGRWVVVGGANGEGDTKGFEGGNIVTSTDGINWIDQVPVEKSAFVGEVAYRLSPIAYGGGQWIGATSGYGGFFRSVDGLNWSHNSAFLIDALPKVQNEAEYQIGIWIVPLQDGTILMSTL
jgi:hypothetical protein